MLRYTMHNLYVYTLLCTVYTVLRYEPKVFSLLKIVCKNVQFVHFLVPFAHPQDKYKIKHKFTPMCSYRYVGRKISRSLNINSTIKKM